MKLNRKLFLVSTTVAMSAMYLAGCGSQTADNTGDSGTSATNDSNSAANNAEKAKAPTTKLKVERDAAFVSGGHADTGWTLKVVDAKTGQPVKDFEVSHEKLMHLIVVSKDLNYFYHLHPQHKGNGVFNVVTKLPMSGKSGFKFYADYTPKGRANEVAQHDLGGASSASLVADKISSSWIVKNVVAGPEHELIATPHEQLKADAAPLFWNYGPRYQVALMPMPAKFVAGQEAMLHFQIRDAKGKPVKALQPYLGGMGHCVVISSDTKSYLHTHPMGDEGGSSGSDVMFHVTFPAVGLYKVWGEFKHNGKIITAAYVVEVGAGDTTDATGDSGDHSSHGH